MVELLTSPIRGPQTRHPKSSTNGTRRTTRRNVPESALVELSTLFKLLADDTRLRILYFLTQQPELHVQALCNRLGQSQPAVSHHLAQLMKARLLERRRQGKCNFYSLQSGCITDLLNEFFERLPESQR